MSSIPGAGSLGAIPGIAIGTAAGNAAGGAILPGIQDLINAAWSRHQSLPLQAVEAAQLVASGERDLNWGVAEARQTGISSERFAALVDMIDTAPDLGTLVEMLRRGTISDAQFRKGARRGNIEDEWITGLLDLERQHLSAAEAASLRQQGYIDATRQHQIAALNGISPADADLQFEGAGLPPGPGEALTMLRRGIISRAEFDQMIREGNTKVKYTDEFAELLNVPLGLASAVEGVIKTQMSPAEGRAAAQKWGVDAATFDQLVLNSGRPIGGMQAVTLYNRKYFNKADVQEVVARSNVRVEYTDAIIELGKHYPSLFQMRQLVQSKAIPPATARVWLNNNGYSNDVAIPLVDSWSQATTAHEKDLAKSEILALYEGRLITKQQATTMLTTLGYAATEIGFMLSLGDARRARRFLDSALTRIHTMYVTRQIDKATASRDMSALEIATDAIDDLLAIWDDERAAQVLVMTPAQVLRAAKLEIVTSRFAYDFLVARGYADQDARILVSIATGMGDSALGKVPSRIG